MLVVIPIEAILTEWSGAAASALRYVSTAVGTSVEFFIGASQLSTKSDMYLSAVPFPAFGSLHYALTLGLGSELGFGSEFIGILGPWPFVCPQGDTISLMEVH